jgi:glycosyltransferase involved in cell wall biosynthesis
VHPTHHLEYANKIIELLENTALQQEFGFEARKKVTDKFSVETVAKQSMSFYDQLITSH